MFPNVGADALKYLYTSASNFGTELAWRSARSGSSGSFEFVGGSRRTKAQILSSGRCFFNFEGLYSID
jgi:hypothetical protein